VTDVSDAPVRRWAGLPTWVRLGILVLVAIVITLVAVVAIRLATRVPTIPFGVTAVEELPPGACLAEEAPDLTEYTVVACDTAHPQQVFATADLEFDESVYALVESSLATFGDQVCLRFLEYRLFLREEISPGDYTAYAIAIPDPQAYAAGETEARCVIAPRSGDDLTSDLHRPMP